MKAIGRVSLISRNLHHTANFKLAIRLAALAFPQETSFPGQLAGQLSGLFDQSAIAKEARARARMDSKQDPKDPRMIGWSASWLAGQPAMVAAIASNHN